MEFLMGSIRFDHRRAHSETASMPDVSRRGFLVTSLAVGFASAAQPVLAQAITTSGDGLITGEVMVPVAGGVMPAYQAYPAQGSGPFPTVLVIQEIFGVHEHIKDVCRRFAKLGYYAISGELYARQGDVSKLSDIKDIFAQIVSKVPDDQVMADLDSLVDFARSSGKADVKAAGHHRLLLGRPGDMALRGPQSRGQGGRGLVRHGRSADVESQIHRRVRAGAQAESAGPRSLRRQRHLDPGRSCAETEKRTGRRPLGNCSLSGRWTCFQRGLPSQLRPQCGGRWMAPVTGVVQEIRSRLTSARCRGPTTAAGRRPFFRIWTGCLLAAGTFLSSPPASAVPDPMCMISGEILLGPPTLPRTLAALRGHHALHVVALGSSSTQGYGASEPNRSYPAQLAAKLKLRFPHSAIRVLNKGVGGGRYR